jgi:hypothetical protein
MNTNAAVKYFKQFREEHNTNDFITNGEVLVWLAEKMDAIEAHQAANSYEAINAQHEKSLSLLDEYFNNTPREEVLALIDKHMPLEDYGVHRTHCCKKHGCKYSNDNCPVASGEIVQSHACEFCHDDEEDGSNVVYLIEKAWLDPMENRNSTGYSPVGFATDLESAEAIVAGGRLFTKDDCWEIEYHTNGTMPEYKYTKLNEMI